MKTSAKDFNESAYLSLNDENKERVEHIYYIAAQLKHISSAPLEPKDFDRLYDMPLRDLRRLSGLPSFCYM